MKIPRLKKHEIVAVLWVDSHYPAKNSWMDQDEYKEFCDDAHASILSLGFYTSQDKEFIRLVADIQASQDGNNVLSRPLNIQKGCIKDIKVLT